MGIEPNPGRSGNHYSVNYLRLPIFASSVCICIEVVSASLRVKSVKSEKPNIGPQVYVGLIKMAREYAAFKQFVAYKCLPPPASEGKFSIL